MSGCALSSSSARRSPKAAQVKNVYDLAEVASLVTFVGADGDFSAEEATALEHAVRIGRSLGVHGILVCADISSPIPLRRVRENLSFHVALSNDGGRRAAPQTSLTQVTLPLALRSSAMTSSPSGSPPRGRCHRGRYSRRPGEIVVFDAGPRGARVRRLMPPAT